MNVKFLCVVGVACALPGMLNGMIFNHVERMNDRICGLAEMNVDVEQVNDDVELANKKLEELIARGVLVDECGKNGITPLMAAANGGLACFVDTLLKAGAKTEVVDKNGLTALDWVIVSSMAPSRENLPGFLPWLVTLKFRQPGRRQCFELLMRHLHMEKTEAEARIVALICQLRKNETSEQKEKRCKQLSQLLLEKVCS